MIRPKIVAEISGNHDGKLWNAKELIESARKAGADYAKLQTYTPDSLTIDTEKDLWLQYVENHTPYMWHKELFDFAKEIGIGLFSTPFAKKDVDFLLQFKPPFLKIASFEAVDFEFVEYCASTKIPLIISLGCMPDGLQISKMLDVIARHQDYTQTTLMHCISKYPAEISEMNLWRIALLRKEYKCKIGLSDHSKGTMAAVIATVLQADMIEEHLRDEYGQDSEPFALHEEEFRELVEAVGLTCKSLEVDHDSASAGIELARSCYVVQDVKKGESFTERNVAKIRPGKGLPCNSFVDVIGSVATCDINRGTPVTSGLFASATDASGL